jgi:hypothetical protein
MKSSSPDPGSKAGTGAAPQSSPVPDCAELESVFDAVLIVPAGRSTVSGYGSIDLMKDRCTQIRLPQGTFVPLVELKQKLGGMPDTGPVCRLIDRMQQFDWLAMGLQGAYYRRVDYLCAAAVAFLVLFEMFAHLPVTRGWWIVLALGVAALAVGVLLQYWGHSRQLQIAFHQARCVAEGLRILVFWRLNGISDSITRVVAERHKYRMSLVTALLNQVDGPAIESPAAARVLTLEHWVNDQLTYFHGAYYTNHIKERVYKGLSARLFIWGITVMVGLIVLMIGGAHLESDLVGCLLALAPCLIVVAAIIEHHAERRGYDANANRYQFAHHVYTPDEETFVGKVRHTRSVWEIVAWVTAGAALVALAVLIALAAVGYALGAVIVAIASASALCAAGSVLIDWRRVGYERKRESNHDKDSLKAWLVTASDTWPTDPVQFRSKVYAAGVEAMHEVIDWYISNIDREIGMPKG